MAASYTGLTADNHVCEREVTQGKGEATPKKNTLFGTNPVLRPNLSHMASISLLTMVVMIYISFAKSLPHSNAIEFEAIFEHMNVWETNHI